MAAAGSGVGAGAAALAPTDATSSRDWIAKLHFDIHPDAIQFNDPEGARLIKKVTARHPDGSVFWTQVFYRSSGKNSRMKGMWFPFLGIFRKGGGFYFEKGMPFNESWPKTDIFECTSRSDRNCELIGRFGTRSFLLAANALNALSDDDELRDEIASRIFEDVVSQTIDPTLRTLISKNGAYDDEKWVKISSELPHASPEEVNRFIGTDIYINYEKPLSEQLNLAAVGIPNSLSLGGGGNRRAARSRRRRSSRSRRSRRYTLKQRMRRV